MRLNQNSESVIVSSENKATNFHIAMNAKAFSALSDSLYKNKIGSIVREISCNAFDAHIAAKNPQPFEIHLPNAMEPYFAVKDYGTGMSHDIITTVYSTLFESTKDQSNDEIGGFGLGSKTFYAYCDSCTITSIVNGIKNHYSAYRDNGLPAIVLMHSEETTEPNGVEVKIGVKKEDYRTFSREVESQLRYLPVKPIIHNGEIKYDTYFNEPTLKTDNIILGDPNIRFPADSNIAVLGVVGYPIDAEIINPHLKTDDISFLRYIAGISILQFQIGEIEVTASREGISYTPETINNIVNKINAARKDITEYLETELNTITLPWDKAVAVNSKGKLTGFYAVTGITIPNAKVYNGLYCFEFDKLLNDTDINMNAYKFSNGGTFRRETGGHTYIGAKTNRMVFIRDVQIHPIARVREFAKVNTTIDIYILEPEYYYEEGKCVNPITEEDFNNLIARYSDAMGGMTITKISSLPEYKKPARIREKVLKEDGTEVDEDIDYTVPKGYYVSLEKLQKMDSVTSRSATPIYDIAELSGIYISYEDRRISKSMIEGKQSDDLLQILSTMVDGIDTDRIYILNTKYVKKIEKNSNLIHIDDYTKQMYAKFMETVHIIKNRIALSNIQWELHRWMPKAILVLFTQEEYLSKLDRKNTAAGLIRLFNIIEKRYERKDKLHTSNYTNNFPELFKNEDSKIYVKFTEMLHTVEQTLPLLSDIRGYHLDDGKMHHLVKYINVMGRD